MRELALLIVAAALMGATPTVAQSSDQFPSATHQDRLTESVVDLRRQADAGSPLAQFALAETLERGETVQKDPKEAASWLRRSARQGYAPAQARLAEMLTAGTWIPQDFGAAYQWLSLAVVATDNEAEKVRLATRRDALANRMPPEEVAAAQRAARAWRPVLEAEQQQREALANAVGAAVVSWEQNQRDTDPQYGLLQPKLVDAINADLRRAGAPETPGQAVQRAAAALRAVKAELEIDVAQCERHAQIIANSSRPLPRAYSGSRLNDSMTNLMATIVEGSLAPADVIVCLRQKGWAARCYSGHCL